MAVNVAVRQARKDALETAVPANATRVVKPPATDESGH
jgi:hypothetical protein